MNLLFQVPVSIVVIFVLGCCLCLLSGSLCLPCIYCLKLLKLKASVHVQSSTFGFWRLASQASVAKDWKRDWHYLKWGF